MISRRTDTFSSFGAQPLLGHSYKPITYHPFLLAHLSEVGRHALQKLHPKLATKALNAGCPEITALRILDFLSSKKGFIHRKGPNFRTVEFYESMHPQLVAQVTVGEPLMLNGLCVNVGLPDTRLTGNSPYPHMGTYLALENIHKIAVGIRAIYLPGITFVLGFEGNLYQKLFFFEKKDVDCTYRKPIPRWPAALARVFGG